MKTVFMGIVVSVVLVILPAAFRSVASAAERCPLDNLYAASLPSPSYVLGLSEADNEVTTPEKPPWWSAGDWPRETKVAVLTAGTIAVIAAFGFIEWDYGSHSFRAAHEHWFGKDTHYGGADKLGHIFTCYALASVYSRIYQDWGYDPNDAILIGAASSWLTMSVIEVGDGFSKSQGFSYEDEIMNTVGVGLAYLRHRFPAIRERVDYRWEWFPSPSVLHGERFDVLTDYSGQKYLLAFKLDGWLRTGSPVLKALELQVGYYTRGYVSDDQDFFHGQHRYGYVGLGLNVTYLLERLTGHRAAGIFDYYQVPYTYLPERWEYE
jgi:hypothetical protein